MLWNGEVKSSETVSMRDENTYVFYQKLHSCPVDFLFVRHCF